MVPNSALPPEVNIASHSIEMMTLSRVILGADGNPQTIILTGQHGVEFKFPGFAFPFVKNGVEVLAIVALVQVTAREPALSSKLIIPQGG